MKNSGREDIEPVDVNMMENTNLEIGLDELQLRCMRILYSIPEGKKILAADISEQLDIPINQIRGAMAEMIAKNFLKPRTYQVTEEGKAVYEKCSNITEELICWMNDIGIPSEQQTILAERLLCQTTPQFLRGICTMNRYAYAMTTRQSSSETIRDNDLVGLIDPGKYEISVCFLDLEQKQAGLYAEISAIAAYFERKAILIVEPLYSRLKLKWQSATYELLEIDYTSRSQEMQIQPKDNIVSIPVIDLEFLFVEKYHILSGELDLTLHFRTETEEKTEAVRLMVTAGYNGLDWMK